MNGLSVNDLHKSFGAHSVLSGLDLVVPAGSLAAILGPSGSGKTTLLRLLAGFQAPDRGTIAIGDRIVDGVGTHVHPEHRRIGYVPQEGGLFPHLTIAGNVAFGLSRAARRRGVGELLELVGLADLARRYPHQLSGGQQQRVALARALAVKPEIVLLDEPFASLDAHLRSSVREEVGRILHQSATTTLLVTHDQDEALSLADQIAVLGDGRILARADPRALYHDPPDLTAATSIGEANILAAHIRDGRACCSLGAVPLSGAHGGPERDGPSQLLLRPEQLALRLHPRDGASGATVVEVRYHGHDALAHIRLSPHAHETLLARVPGDLALTPGQEVWVEVIGPGRAWPSPSKGSD